MYDNYHQTVRHHVLKNSGSEEDVSDVFQESIITLYKQISNNELKLTTDLKGYFFGIVRNIWSSQLRIKSRNTELVSDFPEEDCTEKEDLMILERIVSRAFKKLNNDSQTILKLYSEGITYQEIASIMNLRSENYARRKKYLSKEALIEIIKNDPEYKIYFSLR